MNINLKSLSAKIILATIPIVFITMSLYFAYQLFSNKQKFQEDFDKAIINSVTILKPALSANIYNLEKQNLLNSIKGLYINSDISKVMIFSEKKVYFLGVNKKEDGSLSDLTGDLKLIDFTKNQDLKSLVGFEVYNMNNSRIYISAITDKESSRVDGVIIIQADLKNLNYHILKLIFSAFLGLSFCIFSIIILLFIILNKKISKPLEHLAYDIGKESEDVYATNIKLIKSFKKVSDLSNSQKESMDKIQMQMNQMIESVLKTKKNAEDCNTIVETLNKKTHEGNNIISIMKNSVDMIAKSSENLNSISKIIDDISIKAAVINKIVMKTELLSLNASIESARAGALGKGFSVVAEEVGNLAQMSGKAAKEIEGLIIESQKVSQSVIIEMNESVNAIKSNALNVSNSFKEISSEVVNILENTKDIYTSSNSQNETINNVMISVNDSGKLNLDTFTEMKDLSEYANELSKQSDNLKRVMELMNLIIIGNKVEK
ncbi:methyl-accepting chemotaxis protein [Silvanigrella aquatica]|uniref:Methyl-accepting transducer domain-containing protein n=1 Tax=Silvanigrella aquatica TaxID=1915309 RepID=A0A1L4D0P7_9BACT|nr:methyl-accepting chemotaxis protein [Silvanigrella aquatica]APJ03750.1 hypothetical protein AXG55_07455 [Silvanigrella aquatica]